MVIASRDSDKPSAPAGGAAVGGGASTPRIERCTIRDVNYDRFTVDLITMFTNSRVEDCEIMCPYCHPDGQDGMYVMPEPGCEGIVLQPSDKSNPVLIGFQMPVSQGPSFKGERPAMNGGDIVLATRDKNQIILRRGGVIEIGANPISRRFYIPVGNLIRDHFGQYEAKGLVGEASWRHALRDPEEGQSGDTQTAVVYTWKSREYVEDEKSSIEIRAGHVDDNDNYLEVVVIPQGGEEKFTWRVTKAGDIRLVTKGGYTAEITGAIDVTCANASLKASSVTAESSGNFLIKAAEFAARIAGTALMKAAEVVLEAGSVHLAGRGGGPVIKGLEAVTWFATHAHPPSGGPPTTPFPPGAVSTKVFAL